MPFSFGSSSASSSSKTLLHQHPVIPHPGILQEEDQVQPANNNSRDFLEHARLFFRAFLKQRTTNSYFDSKFGQALASWFSLVCECACNCFILSSAGPHKHCSLLSARCVHSCAILVLLSFINRYCRHWHQFWFFRSLRMLLVCVICIVDVVFAVFESDCAVSWLVDVD